MTDNQTPERITVPEAIEQLLGIVEKLQKAFPSKRFTLDGRLMGDLGEVLAAAVYDVQLNPGLQKHHDAVARDGRKVQIKATMQESLTFPADHIPDYYLGIRIRPDGTFEEVFNGPGKSAWEAVKNRAPTKNNLHSIRVETLKRLSVLVAARDRIPRRPGGTQGRSINGGQ